MKIKVGKLRSLIREAVEDTAKPWIVRGGSEVLTRDVDDDPESWDFEVLPKVTYFTSDELVPDTGPVAPIRRHNWTFKRGNKLYAIDDRQFFSRPEWKYPAAW